MTLYVQYISKPAVILWFPFSGSSMFRTCSYLYKWSGAGPTSPCFSLKGFFLTLYLKYIKKQAVNLWLLFLGPSMQYNTCSYLYKWSRAGWTCCAKIPMFHYMTLNVQYIKKPAVNLWLPFADLVCSVHSVTFTSGHTQFFIEITLFDLICAVPFETNCKCLSHAFWT